jgi:hypothetical protein
MEKLNLKKLNKVEGKEYYRVEIWNYELKKYKPLFGEGSSKLLD